MRVLSYDYRLPSRSVAEVYDALDDALTAFQRERSVRFRGRKFTGEALVNAVLLHFLGMSRDDQRRVLSEYVPRLEAILAGGPATPPPPPPKGKRPRKAG